MENNNFCPFLSDSCRSDCVFYHPFLIALDYGKTIHCNLFTFISGLDEDDVIYIAKEIKKLIENKKK